MEKGQKIVEHYMLEQTVQVQRSGIYVIKAKHVKTNQYYTIKKVNISNQQGDQTQNNGQKILMRQIETLRDINIKRFIKCLKLIRTKRNIYCVFQQYPLYQLSQFLALYRLSLSQRIKYARIICQTLSKVHQKGYIYGNLNPQYIRIDNKLKNNIKFIPSQYLTSDQKKQQISFDPVNQYMSPEVKKKGKISYSSDAYSLGKILTLLGLTKQQQKFNTPIQSIIKNLLSSNPNVRPSLKTVSLCLQIIGNQNSTIMENNNLSISIEKKKYNSLLMTKTYLRTKANRSINYDVKAINRVQKTNNDKKKKKICKIRNLSIYLLDLAKFCIKQRGLNLSYLLIKKATVLTGNLINELKKDPSTIKEGFQYFMKILKQQYKEQKLFLNKLMQVLEIEQHQNGQLEQKLSDEIRQFIKEKRRNIKEIKTNFNSQQRIILIKLYQLSQRIVYGCFQKFFQQAFSEQYIRFQDQRYIQYLSLLPTKEILEKLDNIIQSQSQ